MLLTLLLACSSTSELDDTASEVVDPGPGTLALRFQIDEDLLPTMDDQLNGTFYGSIYNSMQVTTVGPEDDAAPLAEVLVEDIDLSDGGGPSEVLLTTVEFEEGGVTILGFMDTDRNADPKAPEPDDDDPVTLPWDNEFDVVGGAETEATVFLGMLY